MPDDLLPLPHYSLAEIEPLALGSDRVPALLIRPDTPGPHPAAVLQHGFGAEKSDLVPFGMVLATYGCIVLLADAWEHGERFPPSGPNWKTEASTDYFLEVVRHTAADLHIGISTLVQRPEVRKDAILVGGFSMGAMAALLVAAAHPRVGGVVSLAGGPLPDILDVALAGTRPPGAAARAYAQSHDVAEHAARFAPRPLLLSHGRRDNMVPVAGTLRLYAAAKPHYAAHPERLALRLYDHMHHITEEQLRDAVAFIAPYFLRNDDGKADGKADGGA